MHTLDEIHSEYRRLDKLCGINTTEIEISFSTRSVRRYGTCKMELSSSGVWVPVKIIIADFLRSENEPFWETVRHEYAHAAAAIITGEKHGHDKTWRAVCSKIGCSGKTYAEKTEAAEKNAASHAKYKVVCCKCGAENLYMRESKIVKIIRSGKSAGVRCTYCGGAKFELYTRKP